MSSLNSKSRNDLILHEALAGRMLEALEFANIAAELATLETPADEYLVDNGYISAEQRKEILAALAEQGNASPDETQFEVKRESSDHKENHKGSSQRLSNAFSPSFPSATFSVRPTQPSTVNIDNEVSRYEWLEKFAQGGLGAVWRARDTTIDRKVALKEILPKARKSEEAVARFIEEARITGQLQHPGVVPIYDIGQNEYGCPFYIMRFVEGQTLHEAIQSHHDQPRESDGNENVELSLRQLLHVFMQVCRTMDYAHDQGIIHRDLKPRNILLGDYGETLVVDWGLAKNIESNDQETLDMRASGSASRSSSKRSRRETGRISGTPAYLAPEQARGEVHAMDARSDVYSLGVVLFEILTGATPFHGDDSKTIINSVIRGTFLAPREVSRAVAPSLNSICLKAMAFNKSDRFQSARELADEIERFLDGERVLVHPETRVERAQRVLAKHQQTTFTALCGLMLLSLVIGIAAILINHARQAEQAARIAAVAARNAESKARQQEAIAKSEAVTNMRYALDAIDTWLLQLSGDLEFYPGLSQRRQEFLQNAAEYYQDLSQLDSSDRLLQREAARALIRGGDSHQLLGQCDRSAPMFYEAAEWFRTQSELEPEEQEHRKELANALIGKSIALARDPVTRDAAQQAVDEARKVLLVLATQNSEDADVRTALARASVSEGRLHLARRKKDAAVTHFEDARRRLVDVVREPHVSSRHVALYHSTLFELTHLYLDAENFDAAGEVARDAIRSFDKSIAATPTRPDYYEGRMTAHILLGNVRESVREPNEALKQYEAAHEDYRRLMATLHRGEYHSENLAAANINRAKIMLSRGATDDAIRIVSAARNELSHLVQLHGQQARLLRLFAAATSLLGEANAANMEFDSALSNYVEATTVLEFLSKHDAATPDDLLRLAMVYCERSKLCEVLGERSMALSHCDQAIRLLSVHSDDCADTRRIVLASCHLLHGQLKSESMDVDQQMALQLLSECTTERGRVARWLLAASCGLLNPADAMELRKLASTSGDCKAWLAMAIQAYQTRAYQTRGKQLQDDAFASSLSRYVDLKTYDDASARLLRCLRELDKAPADSQAKLVSLAQAHPLERFGLLAPLWNMASDQAAATTAPPATENSTESN